jgi:regulatory helix-turn-helix LysR family protein
MIDATHRHPDAACQGRATVPSQLCRGATGVDWGSRLGRLGCDQWRRRPRLSSYTFGGDMELRHLGYFVSVAEELHFRRPADRPRVGQPVDGEQIRKLEGELAVRLFNRSRHSISLTEAGVALLGEALHDAVVAGSHSAGLAPTLVEMPEGHVEPVLLAVAAGVQMALVPDSVAERYAKARCAVSALGRPGAGRAHRRADRRDTMHVSTVASCAGLSRDDEPHTPRDAETPIVSAA